MRGGGRLGYLLSIYIISIVFKKYNFYYSFLNTVCVHPCMCVCVWKSELLSAQ